MQIMPRTDGDPSVPVYSEREIKLLLFNKQPAHFINEWVEAEMSIDALTALQITRYFDELRANEANDPHTKTTGNKRIQQLNENGSINNKRRKVSDCDSKNWCTLPGHGNHEWKYCCANKNSLNYDEAKAERIYAKVRANKGNKTLDKGKPKVAEIVADTDMCKPAATIKLTSVIDDQQAETTASVDTNIEIVWAYETCRL